MIIASINAIAAASANPPGAAGTLLPPTLGDFPKRSHAGERLRLSVLAIILSVSFVISLHHLDHAAIKPLDEVFHAIVARNLLKHPFVPTLVDRPYLAYDVRNWQANSVWLHKPPMALWQIAASFAVLGVNTLALRLPSAVLATASAGLTYGIGKELLSPLAGLIAAALQSFNPVILMLVHGNVFSDHVDISLLFWTELSMLFLARSIRTGTRLDLTICGFAQGLAFLSKTYPALIVTGVAVVAWLLPRITLGVPRGGLLARRYDTRLNGRGFLRIALTTVAVAGPWLIYTAIRFPSEFVTENLGILRHVNQDVEGWAAPWDRLAFGYWISIFYVYYPAVLAAGIVLLWSAWQQRSLRLCVTLAWAGGVMIPNLMVTSKTMSATLIGWPAMWLLLGELIARASGFSHVDAQGVSVRGRAFDHVALGTWLTAMCAAFSLSAKSIPSQGWGYDPGGFAAIMVQQSWVIWHVTAALAMGFIAGWLLPRLRAVWIAPSLAGVASVVMMLLALRPWTGNHPSGYALMAWRVTVPAEEHPSFKNMGNFAALLPANAAFIVDEVQKFDNKRLEFVADRTCYALNAQNWNEMAQALARAGALPYLVSARQFSLPVAYRDREEGQVVYAIQDPSRAP